MLGQQRNVMPIGRFLCVMVPLLMAAIWLIGSWMEPAAPRPTAKAPPASPATTVGQAAAAASVGPSASLPSQSSVASPQPQVQESRPTTGESGSATSELARSADLAIAPIQTAPPQTAQKHGKKRQVQRHRNKTYASGRQPNYQVQYYNSAHAGYRDPAYAGYRPFF